MWNEVIGPIKSFNANCIFMFKVPMSNHNKLFSFVTRRDEMNQFSAISQHFSMRRFSFSRELLGS